MKERTLHFGCLASKLSEQIPGLPPAYDDLAHAITLLNLHDLLPDAETIKARKRLCRKMEKDPRTKDL